jgi:prevent-host-death family protein
MNKWNISEAKTKFTKLLASCEHDPQIICNRHKPVGVVINIKYFEELMKLKTASDRPTIAQMISEMKSINELEPEDIEFPGRVNRTTPFENAANEMDL